MNVDGIYLYQEVKELFFNNSNSDETVPGFIFKPSEISSSSEAESLLLDYYRLNTY